MKLLPLLLLAVTLCAQERIVNVPKVDPNRVHIRGDSDTSDVSLFNVYGDSLPKPSWILPGTMIDPDSVPKKGHWFHPPKGMWATFDSAWIDTAGQFAQRDSLVIKETMPAGRWKRIERHRSDIKALHLDTAKWEPMRTTMKFGGTFEPFGWTTVVGSDTTKKLAPYSAVVIFTLLQAYSRYEKEAMRDSTWAKVREYDAVIVDAKTRKPREEHIVEYGWIHPNTPPPNPFMKWLRRQK